MNNPMQMMQGNPFFQLINIARGGGNIMPMMRQMAGSNPKINQVMQMINGKNPQQLRTMAENMAKERGVSLEQIVQQLGMPLPK